MNLKRFLIWLLGGVIREPVRIEVVPPKLMTQLRLVDGLISAGEIKAAQSQLRNLIIVHSVRPADFVRPLGVIR